MMNAGRRLWQSQRRQGTGLCIGIDLHYDAEGKINAQMYELFAHDEEGRAHQHRFTFIMIDMALKDDANTVIFLAGVVRYFERVIDAAWEAGIRVYKIQYSFIERFGPLGPYVLKLLCNRLHGHSASQQFSRTELFLALDRKAGDIETSQLPDYEAYLSYSTDTVIPGMGGQYSFDTMTVTTWMGTDVLLPGLPLFKRGCGAMIVTRTSNPSGTTLQDVEVHPSGVKLGQKQEPFRYDVEKEQALKDLLQRSPLAHEIMLYETVHFSTKYGLNDEEGISPLFFVMGATVPMLESFRQIVGQGMIALIPGHGAQKGGFANIKPLIVTSGPLAGHWGIQSSSRAHNYPWLPEYGGRGDPKQLEGELERAIDSFRAAEREAYADAGVNYPF